MALQSFSPLEQQAGKCTSMKQQRIPLLWGGFWREGVMYIWARAPFSGNGSSHTSYLASLDLEAHLMCYLKGKADKKGRAYFKKIQEESFFV